jgi:hypothetical protein
MLGTPAKVDSVAALGTLVTFAMTVGFFLWVMFWLSGCAAAPVSGLRVPGEMSTRTLPELAPR